MIYKVFLRNLYLIIFQEKKYRHNVFHEKNNKGFFFFFWGIFYCWWWHQGAQSDSLHKVIHRTKRKNVQKLKVKSLNKQMSCFSINQLHKFNLFQLNTGNQTTMLYLFRQFKSWKNVYINMCNFESGPIFFFYRN